METTNNRPITIIRQRGLEYQLETITCDPVVKDSHITSEQHRKNLLARLHKDTTVAFVLDGSDGRYEETADLDGGFKMTAIVERDEDPVATIIVTYDGEQVCRRDYPLDEFLDDGRPFENFLSDIEMILNGIVDEDYFFVDDDCKSFVEVEQDGPQDIFDVLHILRTEDGLPVEMIRQVELGNPPLLFTYENEIVLICSEHFAGQRFFVELKRLFTFRDPALVEKAIADIFRDSDVKVIPWRDGTWSFRLPLVESYTKDEFRKQLKMLIEKMQNLIRRVEEMDGLYASSELEMNAIRQFFIYEVIDTSIRLSRLPL